MKQKWVPGAAKQAGDIDTFCPQQTRLKAIDNLCSLLCLAVWGSSEWSDDESALERRVLSLAPIELAISLPHMTSGCTVSLFTQN